MHGSSGSNIYDSWRSQRYPPTDYYHDQQPLPQKHYAQKQSMNYAAQPNDPYLEAFHPHYHPSQHQQHLSQQNAMGLYTYNPRRYHRDYDPDF